MSLMKYVTYAQLEKMKSSAKAHSSWALLYNCALFATNVWNETTGDDLSAMGLWKGLWKGLWPSPRSLAYNIRQREGYEVGSVMHSEWPS